MNLTGGAIGEISSDMISNCYYGGDCTLTNNSGVGSDKITRIEALNTIDYAKGKAWYKNASNWDSRYAWDMINVWQIDSNRNSGYPVIELRRHTPTNESGYWTDSGRYSTTLSGSGSKTDPYKIENAQQLAGLAYAVNSGSDFWFSGVYFKQTADIDLSEYYWQPIGIYFDRTGKQVRRPFLNNYDGNGHTVSGIFTPTGSGDGYSYQGLFGYMTSGSISNLGIKDSYIQGHSYVGGVVAYTCNSISVTNCFNTGIVTGYEKVGGVVGYATGKVTIAKCYNEGEVYGGIMLNTYVGGVLGQGLISVTVRDCYNTGNVSGLKRRIGGVVGQTEGEVNTTNKTIVANCYNTGRVVSTDTNVGGVVGFNSDCAKIINCYNTGYVSGTDTNVGGITGRNAASSSILNCYFGGECTLAKGCTYTSSSPNPVIITKIITLNTTSYAKGKSWYTTVSNWDSEYPWDFNRVWAIDASENEGFPILIEYVETWEDYAASSYAGGSGTQSNPYIIKTPEQLGRLCVESRASTLSGKYYKLGSNIDLSSHIWSGIGNNTTSFAGNKDGDLYTIKNIKTSEDNYLPTYIGLCAYTNGATISNIIMKGGEIKETYDAGAIGGMCAGSTIKNCIVDSVNVTSGTNEGWSVGGVVGYISGSIKSCVYKNGKVQGDHTGAIAGWLYDIQIQDCSVINSTIIGTNKTGIIGGNLYGNSSIISSYGQGTLNGTATKNMYGDSNAWGNWSYNSALNGGYPVQKPLFAIGGISGSTNVYNYLKNTLGFAAA